MSELVQSELVQEEFKPDRLSDAKLIDYILERFHQKHRAQLKELIEFAQKVEEVHESHASCPKGLSTRLRGIAQELEQHMFKEENILFPLICNGQGAMAIGPISVMRHEHVEHETAISHLEHYLGDHPLPDDACRTWRKLYEGIRELMADLRDHIALENDVLFARQ